MGNEGCPFCPDQFRGRSCIEHGSVFAIKDASPVSPGHHLIIPRRHVSDFFDLTPAELADAAGLARRLKAKILDQDDSVTGFNLGVNMGESAGQTVFHCHIHLIPRRDGDTPRPRGGVRGVIPDRMDY